MDQINVRLSPAEGSWPLEMKSCREELRVASNPLGQDSRRLLRVVDVEADRERGRCVSIKIQNLSLLREVRTSTGVRLSMAG